MSRAPDAYFGDRDQRLSRLTQAVRVESWSIHQEGLLMRRGLSCFGLLLSVLLTPMAQVRLAPSPPPSPKLIKAGRVLDVRAGKYLLDQGLITEGERIKDIGGWEDVRKRAPAEAVMIDLSQATLLPGLIDCHAHFLIAAELGKMDPWQAVVATVTQTSPSLRALM